MMLRNLPGDKCMVVHRVSVNAHLVHLACLRVYLKSDKTHCVTGVF